MSQPERMTLALDRSELTNLVFSFTQAVDRADYPTMKSCCGPAFRARAADRGGVIIDVDSIDAFVAVLQKAALANPAAESQHRYFCPAIDVEADSAEIRLSGELHNAGGEQDSSAYRVSGLQTTYRAIRTAPGWRLVVLDVLYQWRQEGGQA